MAQALELSVSVGLATHEPVSDPDECNSLNPEHLVFQYEYNAEACACFFVFTGTFQPDCYQSKPRFNPFHEPDNYFDLCISEESY